MQEKNPNVIEFSYTKKIQINLLPYFLDDRN